MNRHVGPRTAANLHHEAMTLIKIASITRDQPDSVRAGMLMRFGLQLAERVRKATMAVPSNGEDRDV